MMWVANGEVRQIGVVGWIPRPSKCERYIHDGLHGLRRGGQKVLITQQADDSVICVVRVMLRVSEKELE